MLKGVNRKVVEIHNPESLYFEKAVFYLKPDLTSVPMALLTAEAHHCLHPAASAPAGHRRSPGRIVLWLLLLAAAAGAGYLLGGAHG